MSYSVGLTVWVPSEGQRGPVTHIEDEWYTVALVLGEVRTFTAEQLEPPPTP